MEQQQPPPALRAFYADRVLTTVFGLRWRERWPLLYRTLRVYHELPIDEGALAVGDGRKRKAPELWKAIPGAKGKVLIEGDRVVIQAEAREV